MAMFGRAAEDGTTFGRAAEDGGFVDPNALPPADEWPDEASYVPPPPFVRPPPTPPLPPIAPPGYYPPEAGYRSPPGTFGPSGRLGGDTPGYQYAIPPTYGYATLPTYGYATLPTYGYATPPTYGYATPSNWSQLPGGTLLPARPSRLGQRGKRTLIVAGVLVFALIAGGLIADATLRSHHGIRLPAAFAGYSRLTNGTAKQLEDEMRSSISLSGQGSAQDAIIGIYAHTGSDEPTLLFEGFAADDNDVVASQLHRQTPRDVVDETLSGAGALEGAADYPTGKFGGALRCATLDVNRVTAPVCAWADANSIGVTVMRDGDSAADAATIILAFRNQAEH